MQQSEAVKSHLTQLTIICSAIFAGVGLFSGVVWYLLQQGAMPPAEMDLPSWTSTLANTAAFVALLKAHFLPRLFSKPQTGSGEEEWIAWHKRTVIVGFALREGGAFLALVGALLTGRLVGAILMVGLAFLSMVTAWPREANLRG